MTRKSRRQEPKTTAEILAQNARWMRWSMLAFVIYVISIQKEVPIQIPENIKRPFMTEQEDAPLPEVKYTPSQEAASPTQFHPSRTTIKQGTGDLLARCGDKVSLSYTIQGDAKEAAQRAIPSFTFTIGDKNTPAFLGQLADNMKQSEIRQVILDQQHLALLDPSQKDTTSKNFALFLTLHKIERAAPAQDSHCIIGSSWQKPVIFR